MADRCTKEGQFRAKIVSYSLKEAASGAVGIHVKCLLTAEPGPSGGWSDCDHMEADGDIWIIKKDGDTNDRAVESLINHAGWDGNLETIANQGWTPKPCSVTTQRNEYNGEVTYKIGFINAYDSKPQMGKDRAAELQRKYGEKLHRLGGAIKPGAGSPMAAPMDDDQIPF